MSKLTHLSGAKEHAPCVCLLLCGLALGPAIVPSALATPMTFATTGVYDETTQANAVDTDAASNPGNAALLAAGQIVTLSTFMSDVLTAFNNDRGGVVDFGTSTDVTTFNALSAADKQGFFATYGASQAQTLTVTMTTNTGTAPAINLTATSDTAAATPISLSGYMGLSSGGNFGFSFDKPLSEVALTIVSRTSLRNVNPFRIVLDDDTTFDFALEEIANSNGGDDTFFGAKAPPGRAITAFRVTGGGAIRFDDFAFVVVPEPGGYAQAVCGAMCLLMVNVQKRSRQQLAAKYA
jgi:hypothetical protein